MSGPAMRTATGRLTVYALACGYVEGAQGAITLNCQQGVYHVRRNPAHPGGYAWLSCRTLTEARRIFDRLRKESAAAPQVPA